MQLKRLEISGFKSFADKCAIDFPPGISAIVGPNGCGKSNIIDAIKWVMGEQSVKQLRGKSMGDVIFAGTDKRPALNMAEVSLVIAGHDTAIGNIGKYTEIMITRRLYRSGESQYMVNRQPCRLKDINDIFLRYSMGSRSCAIIQQGNIGAITDATAEERRAFIEEAAGVVRYKSRRQEAVSKVNATRDNLLRLTDILEEIENRLAELTLEAGKAKQYQEFRGKLKNTDILISVYYHEQYARKIESAEKLLTRLNEKTTFKSEELERLQEALEEIESSRQEKDRKISEKRSAKAQAQLNSEKLEYELTHLKGEEARISQENANLSQALETIIEKNEKIDHELSGEQQTQESLQKRIDQLKLEIEEEKQTVAEYKDQLNSQARLLDDKRERLMSLSSQHARHQNIFQNATAGKEKLQRRLDRVEDEIEETTQVVSDLSEAESRTRKRMDQLKTLLDALAIEKTACETTLKAKNADLSETIKSVHNMENDLGRLKSRLTLLKKMESNFEWYKDGVRAIMKNRSPRSSDDDGGNIMGITAEIIEPVEGYEHAIEAAIGEALQYIIVSDQDAGVDHINYLKTENAGRSGFIPFPEPVAGDYGRDTGSKSSNDGIRMLSEFVNVRRGFEPVINAMLSGIAVVDEIKDAINLLKNGNRYRKIVTRQGDVVSGSGIMVGGSRDQMSGILEKRQEIKLIQTDIDKLQITLSKQQETRKKLELVVRTLENQLAGLMQKKFKDEAELADVDKTLYKATEKLKHARRQMEIIILERERLAGEKEDISSEISHQDEVLTDITHDIETEKSAIETNTVAIEDLKETLRTFDNRMVDLKLSLTRLETEMDNTRRTLSRLKEFKKEGKDRAEQMRRSLDFGQKRIIESREKRVSVELRLNETLAALKQHKQDLREEESDYQAIVDAQAHTDNSIHDSRTELERIREKIHKLELELSGLQINRENTVNRFLERYSDPFSTILADFSKIVCAPAFSIEKTENERITLRTSIEELGDVNLGAIDAYENQASRRDFLVSQAKDLEDALTDLENVIKKINRITQKLFTQTFEDINEKFNDLFPKLFNGGSAWLELTHPNLPLETGVELMIQPPGKKLSRLSLLSGGEKALSAIAFIFSIFMLNPASFCLLDEIDAPLDDVNVHRFNELLRIIGDDTQIITISHKKKTMEFSDMLFGITAAKNGGSRMVSVNIDQALEINRQASKSKMSTDPRETARSIQ